MGMEKKPKELPQLRVKRIPEAMFEEMKNVSDNSGISVSSLIKRKMIEIIEGFPPRYREPKPKD